MKQLIIFIISSLMFFLLTFVTVQAEADAAPVTVYVDDKRIHYDQEPEITKGRTMVPIRLTMEALGSTVSWDNQAKKAVIKKGGSRVELQVGSTTAYKDGKSFRIDSAPYIKNGRTYLPFRFLSEAFAYRVSWNNTTKVVSIASGYDETSTQVEVPVLMYHHIQEGLASGSGISPGNFRSHMEALKASGYQTITEADLYQHLQQGTPLPEKPVLITFDDGYLSNYTYGYPVLKELGMKATIHLITSRVVGAEVLYPNEIPKLSWNEAQEARGVFSYQGHTHNFHYKGIDVYGRSQGMITGAMVKSDGTIETQAEFEERLLEDLTTSKWMIEQAIGQNVMALAYPYGNYSADTIRVAGQAGYKMAFTTAAGKVRAGHDPFRLNRITAHGSLSGDGLLAKINSY